MSLWPSDCLLLLLLLLLILNKSHCILYFFNYLYCNAEPINIFHGNYDTDLPPIRLSYHHGNHYNSLVDPRRLTIGAGLGFSSLRGVCIVYNFVIFSLLFVLKEKIMETVKLPLEWIDHKKVNRRKPTLSNGF